MKLIITNIKIKKCVFIAEALLMKLHGFTHASSEVAYKAAIYYSFHIVFFLSLKSQSLKNIICWWILLKYIKIVDSILELCPSSTKKALEKPFPMRWIEWHESVTIIVESLHRLILTLKLTGNWHDKDSSAWAYILLNSLRT